jgi:hypothetical protein
LNNNKKRGPYENSNAVGSGAEDLSQDGAQNDPEGKVSTKKFFKSKIDFMAPVKSLRQPGAAGEPLLSDDTYYEGVPQNFQSQRRAQQAANAQNL